MKIDVARLLAQLSEIMFQQSLAFKHTVAIAGVFNFVSCWVDTIVCCVESGDV